MRHSRRSAAMVFAVTLAVLTLFPSTAIAGPTPVSGCRTLGAPGAYALAADIPGVDTTCLEIPATHVTLALSGHPLAGTGSGFAGSCQVPEFTSRGVSIAPELTGITLKGPGTITGFDNGVVITGSNAHVRGLTIAGPPCDPIDCPRPVSNGI